MDAEYEPILTSMRKAALDSEGFLSSASFEQTSVVLARESLRKPTDFIFGLKECTIVGDFIRAGTGIMPTPNYSMDIE